MDMTAALGLAIPLGIGIAAHGCGVGIGTAVSGALGAMARQPEAIGKLQTAMLIGVAFIEALTIYAMVIGFILMPKLG
ncbi:ATP synthase F0 subunit C [bacterium]|nr:ATP synthase F0 subunit C [bacterium]